MIGRSLPLVALVLAATGAAAVGGSVTASAYSSGGVSAGPLHWDPSNPQTRNYYIPTVAPGGSFTDQIRVQNPNSDSVDLFVDAVDGITAIPSGAVYANRTDPRTKAGAWVTPAVSTLTIGGNQNTLVSFTVHVPPGTPPGDHLAGVAFENAHPTAGGGGTISIASVVRTVVGVLIEVPGPASFQLNIAKADVEPLSSAQYASVVVTMTDTGWRLGKPRLTVTLTGPNSYSRTVTHQFDTVLPQDTIPLPFPWPDALGPGTYHIKVCASADGMTADVCYTDVSSSSTTLPGVPSTGAGIPGPGAQNGAVARQPAALPGWALALAIGSGVLLIVLLGLGFVVIRLLRGRKEIAGSGPATGTT